MKQQSNRPDKRAGFILLPVILAMSLIAAIAFLLNRDNGIHAEMVAKQMAADRARYAAEAGLQAINALVQSLKCNTSNPNPVSNNNFGGAKYTASVKQRNYINKTIDLIATGTFNDSPVTLERKNVVTYKTPTSNSGNLQPC